MCFLAQACVYTHAADNSAPTQGVPYEAALLWKVGRPGVEPSYLFGTIHLEDPRITKVPPQVVEVLGNAKSFMLEVVMHPAAQAVYAERAKFSDGEALQDHLDGALFERLVGLARDRYDVPESALVRLKPWAVFTFLSRPKPQTGRVLDTVLEELAESRRIPVYGLETVDELVATFDTMPMPQQVAILEDTIRNHDAIVEQVEELTELYLQHDLAGMVALNERAHDDEALFKVLMERAVYQRNERIVERIQEPLANGGAFIAVGALHLPGEQGLLQLLLARGYNVVPVF